MTLYYLGGYYLIRQNPKDTKMVYTCSTCRNDSLLGDWSYSWVIGNNNQIETVKKENLIDDDVIDSVRTWVDKSFNDKRIGWLNLFKDLEAAKEYKQNFFPHLSDIKIIGIYFSESEIEALLSEFKPQKKDEGTIGLYENLSQKIPETQSSTEILLGFDLIGIESHGGFHSFYCHEPFTDLTERFDLTINDYGLFEDSNQWQRVLDYMNDEANGFEPVPWFVCKNKLVID